MKRRINILICFFTFCGCAPQSGKIIFIRESYNSCSPVEVKKGDLIDVSNKVGCGCDSLVKAWNVQSYEYQSEKIKHHNQLLPEESEYLPELSADSCYLSYPL